MKSIKNFAAIALLLVTLSAVAYQVSEKSKMEVKTELAQSSVNDALRTFSLIEVPYIADPVIGELVKPYLVIVKEGEESNGFKMQVYRPPVL